jgi:hypothetical protein
MDHQGKTLNDWPGGWDKVIELAATGDLIRWAYPSGGVYVGIGVTTDGVIRFMRNTTDDASGTLTLNMAITPVGNVGIGVGAPTAKLHIAGSTGYNQLRLQTPYTPSGQDDPNGNTGDIAWDNNAIHVKTSVGWKYAPFKGNIDADTLDGNPPSAYERVSNKGVANGYAPLDVNAKVPVTHIADNLRVATIGLTVGDGVNTITTGFKGAIPVPFSGTITEWTIVSTDANPPTSGSIEIDILKSTYANYPTMSSMVGTGTKPNIANSNKGQGTPTGWSTTTINAGDIIGFNVTSVTGLKRITIVLKVMKS